MAATDPMPSRRWHEREEVHRRNAGTVHGAAHGLVRRQNLPRLQASRTANDTRAGLCPPDGERELAGIVTNGFPRLR